MDYNSAIHQGNKYKIDQLRILILEDSEDDYLLLLRELKKSNIKIFHKLVSSLKDFEESLSENWDIILSDYHLGPFNGYDALMIYNEKKLDMPFIIISGVIGEENAVRLMKAGAKDYFNKDNLSRLIPAIEREYIEFKKREEARILQKQKEDAQEETEYLLKVAEKSRATLLQMVEDLRQAKEKAEEMNKLKSYFFAIMSHELRTPFVGILGYAEMLLARLKEPEDKKLAEIIIKSSNRLTSTLNKILQLSKIEFEDIPIQIEKVNVNDLIESDLKLFLPLASQKNLAIKKYIFDPGLCIKTDAKILSEIFCNLLDNAIKFTPSGNIDIEVNLVQNEDKEVLVIKVKDTGIGIPKEGIDLIWKEFRQISEGRARIFEGTGLGLTLCKKYIERLDGRIYVDSELGKGSTFTVELPIKKTTLSNFNDGLFSKELEKKTDKKVQKRILYVEDDPDSQMLIQTALENIYDVVCANNSETALKLVMDNHFDAILMDINLGYNSELDGVKLTETLRDSPFNYKNPIIAMTAYASENNKKEFISRGISHYMTKPFSLSTLKELLADLFKDS